MYTKNKNITPDQKSEINFVYADNSFEKNT